MYVVMIACIVLWTSVAHAATYYVATTGTDNAGCGSSGSPCLTIEYAYENKVSAAGDTILVKPGTYTGGGSHPTYGRVRLNKQGTSGSPITIKSETYRAAILDGGASATYPYYFYFEGSGGSGLASYNIVDGFVITNTYKNGIMMWGDNNTLRNNEIHHVGTNYQVVGDGGSGVYEDQESSGNLYEGNYIHDNPATGLYLLGDNTTVINNLFVHNGTVGNGHYGMQIRGEGTVTNMKVYNNTFASNMKSGIVVWQNMNGVEIKNNIFYQNVNAAVDFWYATGSGVDIDKNVSHGNGDGNVISTGSTVSYTATNWISSSPLFVNAPASDYHLQLSSPAKDAGLTLASVTHDYDAVVRPQGSAYDIGAYEYVVTAPTNNLALNKTTTVSSTETGSFPGSNAVDGSLTTRWSSAYSDPQWIYVDLVSSYTVTGVKLAWEWAYGSTFKIQTSANASDWTDVYSTSSGTGGTQILDVTPSTGRYVRMYGTARGTSYGYSLWEFEVYGSPPTASRALSGVRLIGGRMQ